MLNNYWKMGSVDNPKLEDLKTIVNSKGSTEEFNMGKKIEQEHGPKGPDNGKHDITGGDPKIEAKITAAHLAEDDHYYTNLKQMEEASKKKLAEKFASDVLKATERKLAAMDKQISFSPNELDQKALTDFMKEQLANNPTLLKGVA